MSSPALVPELLVADIAQSIDFWCGPCGFSVDYQRRDEGFACLSRDAAHVMLEQHGIGRNWITAPLERPLGRGINLQITVPDLEPILAALGAAGHALFMAPETKWYVVGHGEEAGVRQFLVADPDGHLLRFQTSLGRRRLQW
jgi:catechol 2,3-dioxygenase-like lactoylglutathione lyase family enzyme